MSFDEHRRRSPYRALIDALDREIAVRKARLMALRMNASARREPPARKVTPSIGPTAETQPDIRAPIPLGRLDSLGPPPSLMGLDHQIALQLAGEIKSKPDNYLNEYGSLVYQDKNGSIGHTPLQKGNETTFNPAFAQGWGGQPSQYIVGYDDEVRFFDPEWRRQREEVQRQYEIEQRRNRQRGSSR